jgi:N-ethylmaleimide reductase
LYPTLFSDFDLGNTTLPNRMVLAPMTRSRATQEHTPTPIMAEYYAQRASAGLLITEGTAPTANGCGYARIPGIWSQEQIDAWEQVTDAVHAKGGRIAMQLMHTGRVGHPHNMPEGARVLAPSQSTMSGEMYTDEQGPQPYPSAEEMTEAEIQAAIAGFVKAAQNAIEAGFDMVEIHGANGYLVDQFLSPSTNLRADSWGGSVENRARFALDVAKGIAAAIGAEKVGIRLSPGGVFNDIQPWPDLEDDFVWLAGELGKLELAYLHLVDHSAMGAPPPPEGIKQSMRRAFDGPLILSGGYSAQRAEADLAANQGELVAFGRPWISNPDLPERFNAQAPLNDPDFSTFYTPGAKGYTDYPAMG